MNELIYNHNEIYTLLFHGQTQMAIQAFLNKTDVNTFTPFTRNAYLSSLNYGIYNYILMKEKISLHDCCMENEKKILSSTKATMTNIGSEIIFSYGNDQNYLIQKYQNKHIRAAILYIHNHLNENITLEKVSQKIFINKSYLCVLFKREVRMSFCDYIMTRRIHLAKKLMLTSNLSCQEIAEMCGFRNATYFSTCFKKYENCKPSEYRKDISS